MDVNHLTMCRVVSTINNCSFPTNVHNTLVGKHQTISLFYQRSKWRTEQWNDFPKFMRTHSANWSPDPLPLRGEVCLHHNKVGTLVSPSDLGSQEISLGMQLTAGSSSVRYLICSQMHLNGQSVALSCFVHGQSQFWLLIFSCWTNC